MHWKYHIHIRCRNSSRILELLTLLIGNRCIEQALFKLKEYKMIRTMIEREMLERWRFPISNPLLRRMSMIYFLNVYFMFWNLSPPSLFKYPHSVRWHNLPLVPSLLSYHFESKYAQPCFEYIKMIEYVKMNLFSRISCNNIEFIWWDFKNCVKSIRINVWKRTTRETCLHNSRIHTYKHIVWM